MPCPTYEATFTAAGQAIARHLDALLDLSADDLLGGRLAKFDAMGAYAEGTIEVPVEAG